MNLNEKAVVSRDATVTLQAMVNTVTDEVWIRAAVDGREDLYAESDKVPRCSQEASSPRLGEQALDRLRAKVRPEESA